MDYSPPGRELETKCVSQVFLGLLPGRACQLHIGHFFPRSYIIKVARLDFWGGYLPSLSINYVAMSKDMEKRLPQLYYIKMKISYDLGFITIGVAMATL